MKLQFLNKDKKNVFYSAYVVKYVVFLSKTEHLKAVRAFSFTDPYYLHCANPTPVEVGHAAHAVGHIMKYFGDLGQVIKWLPNCPQWFD